MKERFKSNTEKIFRDNNLIKNRKVRVNNCNKLIQSRKVMSLLEIKLKLVNNQNNKQTKAYKSSKIKEKILVKDTFVINQYYLSKLIYFKQIVS